MIEIVLDSETTGLSKTDDRIVELGCVEIDNLIPTGRTYHVYIDPRKPMPREAQAVHGLSDDFLAGKPVFRQVMNGFLEFIGDHQIVAHNAPFDIGFINAELERAGRDKLKNPVVDTLKKAKEVRPGKKNGLDFLAKEYNVDTSKRLKHGALIDADILAKVYLELCGGSQRALDVTVEKKKEVVPEVKIAVAERKKIRRITKAEFERHLRFTETMISERKGESVIWAEYEMYASYLEKV